MMKKLIKEVQSNLQFLKSKKIWHILSENVKVISCLDAAANRNRLGHKGIPIFDELKTELGYFINKEKKKQKLLVHCRGNQKIDRLKISSVLNADYQRLESGGNTKGLINPFSKEFRNLFQIFDSSIIKKFQPPYTMMTNAGDFEYAIEFEPSDLISNLKNASINDIIRKDNYENYKKHKIGILTGNSPESGMLLWKKINESVKEQLKSKLGYAFRGDLSYPEITIESVPEMGASMELEDRYEITKNTVIKSVINLCENGATIICLACNTTQIFKNQIEEICSLYEAEFISIATVLERFLINNDIESFDFIGISYVTDFTKYSAFKDLASKFSISIPEKDILEKINRIAFEAKKDAQNNKTAQPLGNILSQHTKNDTIVIALTEVSTVLDHHRKLVKSKKIIDTLQLLANYIAKKYVEGIYDTLYIDEHKDNIVYQKVNKIINKGIKNQLWKILLEVDYEFVPPLSFRDSTTFSFDNETKNTKIPQTYYESLLKQEIILSKQKSNNIVTGFISYIPNHNIRFKDSEVHCFYISTIAITKGARGNGITKQFYKKIEEEVKKSDTCNTVATRTWSTNKTHIVILKSLGYKKVIEIKDDRGSGIHTVYYAKEVS